MNKIKIIFSLAVILFGLALFALIRDNEAWAEAPLCVDINLEAEEESACRIKVENTSSSSIDNLKTIISFSDRVKIVSYDSDWSCSVATKKMTCTKNEAPPLEANKSDFLGITFRVNKTGTYNFSIDSFGSGTTVATTSVQYSGNTTVPFHAVVPTANAVDDDFGTTSSATFVEDTGTNDTLCSFGTTTFNLRNPSNGTVVPNIGEGRGPGGFTFTFTALGSGSFDYDILCDGTVIDSAHVVMVYAVPPTADAVSDSSGYCSRNNVTVDLAANDTLCSSGTTTFDYYDVSSGTVVNSFDASTGMINLDVGSDFLVLRYNILCNGDIIDNTRVMCMPSN